jgi:hypothetical protein
MFSFSASKTLLHALLSFKVSVEKSDVILIVYLYMLFYFFSLTHFNIMFLFFVFQEGEQLQIKDRGNMFNKIIAENFRNLEKQVPIQI